MISKKSLVAVLDKSIILTITAPNDNANQDPVQCAPGRGPNLLKGKFTKQNHEFESTSSPVAILGSSVV